MDVETMEEDGAPVNNNNENNTQEESKGVKLSLEILPEKKISRFNPENGEEILENEPTADEVFVFLVQQLQFVNTKKNEKTKDEGDEEKSPYNTEWHLLREKVNQHFGRSKNEISKLISMIEMLDTERNLTVMEITKPPVFAKKEQNDIVYTLESKKKQLIDASDKLKEATKRLKSGMDQEARYYSSVGKLRYNWKISCPLQKETFRNPMFNVNYSYHNEGSKRAGRSKIAQSYMIDRFLAKNSDGDVQLKLPVQILYKSLSIAGKPSIINVLPSKIAQQFNPPQPTTMISTSSSSSSSQGSSSILGQNVSSSSTMLLSENAMEIEDGDNEDRSGDEENNNNNNINQADVENLNVESPNSEDKKQNLDENPVYVMATGPESVHALLTSAQRSLVNFEIFDTLCDGSVNSKNKTQVLDTQIKLDIFNDRPFSITLSSDPYATTANIANDKLPAEKWVIYSILEIKLHQLLNKKYASQIIDDRSFKFNRDFVEGNQPDFEKPVLDDTIQLYHHLNMYLDMYHLIDKMCQNIWGLSVTWIPSSQPNVSGCDVKYDSNAFYNIILNNTKISVLQHESIMDLSHLGQFLIHEFVNKTLENIYSASMALSMNTLKAVDEVNILLPNSSVL
eukprot:TRINITY_DN6027_c0_g3_i1.p1 TRINITY_DN6027_c0_g3~~TRINITY_DN6027_c0_g3_i1.p1  ORF type:complete len:624 (+),score=180.61 TRINITY_DN6027_c0_g3_i1:39-1910(+)